MPELRLQLAHHTPGRVRLQAPSIVGRTDEGRRIADAAARITGVSKVEARSATGSVVIFYTGDWPDIGARLAEALGGEIVEPPVEAAAPAHHAMDAAAVVVDALDEGASRAFGRRTDISELAFLGLLTAGVVQLARGQVFAPAVTLFSQALEMMAVRRSRGPRG